jgi:hypothetical protein
MNAFYPKMRSASFLVFCSLLPVNLLERRDSKAVVFCMAWSSNFVSTSLIHRKKIVITFLDASKSEPGGTFTNVPIRINIRQTWNMFQNGKTACPWFLCTWRRLPKRRVKSPRVTRQNSAAMRSDISQSGGKMGPCRSSNSMRWRFNQLNRLSTLSSHACSSLSLKREGYEISSYLGF